MSNLEQWSTILGFGFIAFALDKTQKSSTNKAITIAIPFPIWFWNSIMPKLYSSILLGIVLFVTVQASKLRCTCTQKLNILFNLKLTFRQNFYAGNQCWSIHIIIFRMDLRIFFVILSNLDNLLLRPRVKKGWQCLSCRISCSIWEYYSSG